MCLAVPAQIVEMMDGGLARCDLNGVKKEINVSLIANPQVGDWVIVHVGFALNRIDEAQAQETLKMLSTLTQSGEG
ncbi:MAG: HypC/HybG/HupF family hydrogenase formation chaperone [Burkholderiaceae bacterium]|nr:HypC/HybG/HupF family hydrogenase formation chaperone [Burkholderiaceae bacterium]